MPFDALKKRNAIEILFIILTSTNVVVIVLHTLLLKTI